MHIGLVCSADIECGLDLANVLHDARMSVTLYLSHARAARLVGSAERTEERIHELNLVPPTCRVRLARYPRLRDPRSLAVVRRTIEAIHREGVDVVHIIIGPGELWLAVLAWLLRDIPVTTTFSEPKPNLGDDLPVFVASAINQLVAFGSEMIIVNCAQQVAFVQKMYRIPAKRIAYVPLCPRITVVRWSVRKHAEEPGTVLFFGEARRHKGLEYLVRAQPFITREVPHARILISAHGRELERCRQMIDDSTKFDIHEGFAPGEMMAAFYERASLVALPYISAGSSGILLDAYSFGKPVVASNVGCLPEYVKDGDTGLLVPPADVEKLAQAIVHLLSDDGLRHRMGENGKRWMDELQQSTAMQSLQVYEKAMSFH